MRSAPSHETSHWSTCNIQWHHCLSWQNKDQIHTVVEHCELTSCFAQEAIFRQVTIQKDKMSSVYVYWSCLGENNGEGEVVNGDMLAAESWMVRIQKKLEFEASKFRSNRCKTKPMVKTPGIQNRLAQFHGSILSCLGPTIAPTSQSFTSFSLMVQLHGLLCTLYNVHYDKRHAGDLLRALHLEKNARPPLFFPTTKWLKVAPSFWFLNINMPIFLLKLFSNCLRKTWFKFLGGSPSKCWPNSMPVFVCIS